MKYNILFRHAEKNNKALQKLFTFFDTVLFSLDPSSNKKYFAAGGSIKDVLSGIYPKDIDVYFECRDEFDRISTQFGSSHRVVRETKNSISYLICPKKNNIEPVTIDLVHSTYGNASSILDNFDFTVCCAAISPSSFYHHEHFFWHVMSKQLVLNKGQSDIICIRRLIKYLQKGYKIDSANLLEIIKFVRAAPLDDEIIEEFLTNQDNYSGLSDNNENTSFFDLLA